MDKNLKGQLARILRENMESATVGENSDDIQYRIHKLMGYLDRCVDEECIQKTQAKINSLKKQLKMNRVKTAAKVAGVGVVGVGGAMGGMYMNDVLKAKKLIDAQPGVVRNQMSNLSIPELKRIGERLKWSDLRKLKEKQNAALSNISNIEQKMNDVGKKFNEKFGY